MKRLRGDTIIELMLAFSIFSLAAVSTIAIMNRGAAMSQQSLEVSLVRAQMDGQAETIRYLRDTSSPLWDTLVTSHITTKVAPLSPSTCPSASDIRDNGGFFVGQQGGSLIIRSAESDFSAPATYARIGSEDVSDTASHGLWVQIAKSDTGSDSHSITAYDVYVHACWDSLVTDSVPATLGTIVRIYDK
jgi:hypothetical protein